MLSLAILLFLGVSSIMLVAILQDDEDDSETYDKWYSERKTLGSKFTQK